METPWVILGRVICGFPAPFDVDEHTAAAAVDEAPVAQEEEDHAAVAAVDEEAEVQAVEEHIADSDEEAAEHVEAVDDEAEVQAVADLDEDEEAALQAEHVADLDSDEEAVLQAVAGHVEDLDEETVVQAEQRAAAAARTDFTVPLSLELRVTVLSAGRGAHPNPRRPDVYPYIIAAGTVFLLVHFSELPTYGTNFDLNPPNSHLVVARDFETTADGETMTASAERVPDREDGFPALRSIENVVFDTYYRGDEFLVGELIVPKDGHLATFVYLGPSTDYQWAETNVRYPLGDVGREWTPHGSFVLDGRYWWFDLSWGILSLDPVYYRHAIPSLVFHDLPGDRALDEATPGIEMRRCVTGSRNKVRYVEIVVPDPDPESEAATVAMWSLSRIPGAPVGSPGWRWDGEYAVNLVDIWNDDSYFQAELPREVPVLAAVCPSDPDLVYFALEHHLFGVNVPQHRVVHSEGYELVYILGLDNPNLAFSRYVLAWSLPPEVFRALDLVGINP